MLQQPQPRREQRRGPRERRAEHERDHERAERELDGSPHGRPDARLAERLAVGAAAVPEGQDLQPDEREDDEVAEDGDEDEQADASARCDRAAAPSGGRARDDPGLGGDLRHRPRSSDSGRRRASGCARPPRRRRSGRTSGTGRAPAARARGRGPSCRARRRASGSAAGAGDRHDDVHRAAAELGVDDRRGERQARAAAPSRRQVRARDPRAGRARVSRSYGLSSKPSSPSTGSPSWTQTPSRRSSASRLPMPMNPATYSVAGSSKTSSGRTELLDLAGAHDREPVAERERLGLVVRDVDGGEVEARVELVDLAAHVVAQPRVEIAQRLVEQHEVRPGDEPAREGDALLLPAAELGGIAVEEVAAVDELGDLVDPLVRNGCASVAAPAAGSRCSGAPSCAATARTTGRPCRCCACSAGR